MNTTHAHVKTSYTGFVTAVKIDPKVEAQIVAQPGLPDGLGAIAIDGNGIITVTIQWTGFNGAQEELIVESQR